MIKDLTLEYQLVTTKSSQRLTELSYILDNKENLYKIHE